MKKFEEQAQILLAEDNIDYETAMADEDYRPVLEQEFISRIGYVIEPQYLFGHLVKKIEKQAFEMEDLSNAIKNIEILHGVMIVKMTLFTYLMI